MSRFTGFHPVVAQWFEDTFGPPTSAQAQGWPAIQAKQHTLIAAPTGSGKTLAAFLCAIDDLIRQSLGGVLRPGVQVLYISPLKALSHDVQKNLQIPLDAIEQRLVAAGAPNIDIRVEVRTGDTPSSKRQSMVKNPPHILVTTPESLYILLTSTKGRAALQSTRTVIVDEIHALARDKRGSHLALSLARLEQLTDSTPQLVGLSATQKPLTDVAEFLVGPTQRCHIVDVGHQRPRDLAIEVPPSELSAVMSHEVWSEVFDRLAALIESHRTTLIFVNTRRLAERVSAQLSERIGAEFVTSHHGSLARQQRLDAETRLKRGELRALVATASLELGIDIGSVDLVCQLGSTRSISTLLQRIGRSGHAVNATPKGRLFPLTRDDLVEMTAALWAVYEGELDRLIIPELPLDILAQQIVAEVACGECDENELFSLIHATYPFRHLERKTFDAVVEMLAQGFTTRRGRRSAYIHYDAVHGMLRPRRGSQLTAVTSGGAIPDTADYIVVLEPDDIVIGSVHEDFAVESSPGDIFQLGNTSWQILRVEAGRVRVQDAAGQPPTLPFWLGEAPGRTDELSHYVSRLREAVTRDEIGPDGAILWLQKDLKLPESAAQQLTNYLWSAKIALGVMPSQRTLVIERFFDESGGMQLVVHAPFGSRINRAWGLSLRKRFCRSFNFELQAAATEDALLLSLGAQHSFPLDDVFSFLHSNTVREVLVQAMLDAPIFGIRWRWNATRALALPRFRGGKKVPPQLQRMLADDLVAAVFPDQLACLENIAGDREIPDHPLVDQAIRDCLQEAMDLAGLIGVLKQIESGAVNLVARDVTEPSPLTHEILNARPYAFLDDAPLEERRTQAVYARRTLDFSTAKELSALDGVAIQRVRSETWPAVHATEELHDALMWMIVLPQHEAADSWRSLMDELVAAKRATYLIGPDHHSMWIAVERLPLVRIVWPQFDIAPAAAIPSKLAQTQWTVEDAIVEILRGQLECRGPVAQDELAALLLLSTSQVEAGFARLEMEGFAMRGEFDPLLPAKQWCERRLLARIHRYTLDKLRQEIAPVSAKDFFRFLCDWQHVTSTRKLEDSSGVEQLIAQLQGYDAAAIAWEHSILRARTKQYQPEWLDSLCLSGRVTWFRRQTGSQAGSKDNQHQPSKRSRTVAQTPVALIPRAQSGLWQTVLNETRSDDAVAASLSSSATVVLKHLEERGATFFDDLLQHTHQLRSQLEEALGELVAQGLVHCDGFAGLRALISVGRKNREQSGRHRSFHRRYRAGRSYGRHSQHDMALQYAGRWAIMSVSSNVTSLDAEAVEGLARRLLNRYGVIARRLIEHEGLLTHWRDLLRCYRRLEARGEIRGGRFINNLAGEQYALPEAVGLLRQTRNTPATDELIVISGVDPLNLVGRLLPGPRIARRPNTRIFFRAGIPLAYYEAKQMHAVATDLSDRDLDALRRQIHIH